MKNIILNNKLLGQQSHKFDNKWHDDIYTTSINDPFKKYRYVFKDHKNGLVMPYKRKLAIPLLLGLVFIILNKY
jgi:hypothetical protein